MREEEFGVEAACGRGGTDRGNFWGEVLRWGGGGARVSGGLGFWLNRRREC